MEPDSKGEAGKASCLRNKGKEMMPFTLESGRGFNVFHVESWRFIPGSSNSKKILRVVFASDESYIDLDVEADIKRFLTLMKKLEIET